jgi:Leucine-rich repeat (LRR) protein
MNSRVVATMNCCLKGNRRTTTFIVLLVNGLPPINRVHATDKLDKAIERIQSLGGQIKRDEKLPGRPLTEITLRGNAFDGNVPELRFFTNLTKLDLGDTDITDAGLKEVSGLKNLKVLYLRGTKISDASVTELRKTLPRLRISR